MWAAVSVIWHCSTQLRQTHDTSHNVLAGGLSRLLSLATNNDHTLPNGLVKQAMAHGAGPTSCTHRLKHKAIWSSDMHKSSFKQFDIPTSQSIQPVVKVYLAWFWRGRLVLQHMHNVVRWSHSRRPSVVKLLQRYIAQIARVTCICYIGSQHEYVTYHTEHTGGTSLNTTLTLI